MMASPKMQKARRKTYLLVVIVETTMTMVKMMSVTVAKMKSKTMAVIVVKMMVKTMAVTAVKTMIQKIMTNGVNWITLANEWAIKDNKQVSTFHYKECNFSSTKEGVFILPNF